MAEKLTGYRKCVESLLQVEDSDVLQGLDMTGLAKLLYRDQVRQKHSDNKEVRDLMEKKLSARDSRKPPPVTAHEQVIFLGQRMIEALSFFHVGHYLSPFLCASKNVLQQA